MARTVGAGLTKVIILCAVAAAAWAQTPVVASGGTVNAANGISPVTPGSLVSIYGTSLAASTVAGDTIPLSNTINNVNVTLNGIPAPLLFVSSGQINAQVPWNVLSSGTSGTAALVVSNNGQKSAAQNVPVGPFSPGIFDLGNNIAVAINNSDGTIAAPPGAIAGVTSRPAKIGDPYGLAIWCTGLGAVSPSVTTGAAAGATLRTASTFPTVTVGGQQVTVVWAGLTPQFPGVNQINITLPAGTPTGNAVPIQVSVGGITTSNTLTIAVSQ
jgi:uncharacterized protein (TIGR03437 family)